jgi:predicted small integral membrane protein
MKLGKILLVASMGIFLALAAFNNITMSQGGLGAVKGAISMATTFQAPGAMWRAIASPTIAWILFATIVVAEAAAAAYCLLGAGKMWAARGSAASFNGAKSTAIIGLSIVATFYFFAFHAIAQEWFLMWQSTELNVLQDAFRNFAAAMLMMLWVNTADQ